MSDKAAKYANRPFKDLGALLKHRNIPIPRHRVENPSPKPQTEPPSPQKESELFFKAMADVTPIVFNKIHKNGKQPHAYPMTGPSDDEEVLAALKHLIRSGHGFVVSDTPEYMESANPGVSAEILRRLHQGHYAIQDFVDLHGLRVPEAEQVFEGFIRRSIKYGLRAVLIVHGRGLTSPKEPVLKHKVYSWLSRGRLRKWVIAFTSARSCDGGTGATYALLRRRSMTKSRRRMHSPTRPHHT